MRTPLKRLSITLGAALLLLSAGPLKAGGWGDGGCNARIRKEHRDLDRAIDRFGPWSRRANEERYELNRAIEHCRYRGNGAYSGGTFFFGNNGWGGYYRHDRDDHARYRDRDRDRDHRRHRDRGRYRDRY